MEIYAHTLKFAAKGGYVLLYGDKKAVTIKIDEKRGLEIQNSIYTIPESDNRYIMDLQIATETECCKCMLAEFDMDLQKIVIKNYHTPDVVERSIGLNFSKSEQLTDYKSFFVRISEDFSKVIFCYGMLNYLQEYRNGMCYQEELLYLKKKNVRSILPVGEDFYIICCKGYDKDLDVYCTRWVNKYRYYKVSIDRRIEPNSIRVFDSYILRPSKKLRQNVTMGILSARDQMVFYDIVEFPDDEINAWVEGKLLEKPEIIYLTETIDGFASSLSQQWPFICFRDIKQGWLWLIDLNKINEVQILVLPEQVIEV
jgi:hypothetical protein